MGSPRRARFVLTPLSLVGATRPNVHVSHLYATTGTLYNYRDDPPASDPARDAGLSPV
ncbi:hypothetical protein FTUN_0675 [Frigoriglobus tundricola]|uniref:Uncharacterized protein n=1 Tax=Frigoriglobus tundricola TaxID=2774151 RepID=A0A6M5YIL1_9BACT|nr:hypothetical protein FTUN_0675 [Frigoriglobus tundricola]